MSRLRLRLGGVLELVLVLALGMATLRASLADPWVHSSWVTGKLGQRLPIAIRSVLAGVVLAECAVLGGLALRRRGPARWGLGRWCWAFAGLYLVLEIASNLLLDAGNTLYWDGRLPDRGAVLRNVGLYWHTVFGAPFPWALAAGWIAARLARWPGDPAPDLRERAGRGFAALVIATDVVQRVLLIAKA